MNQLNGKKIAFIGAGNMAEAIARGLLNSGMSEAKSISACDPSEERQKFFASMGCAAFSDNSSITDCDIVIFAVKPQVFDNVIGDLNLGENTLAISIAAGVTCARIERAIGGKARIVRVMPNTPMQVGCGMSAICRGPRACNSDIETVSSIFGAGGKTVEIEESMMDAVTAVSGSGPAYLFLFAEALENAAIDAGLPQDAAKLLGMQTVIGSAKLLSESGIDASELRQRVTSPGGTTQAALNAFESGGFVKLVSSAVSAAKKRSAELAE